MTATATAEIPADVAEVLAGIVARDAKIRARMAAENYSRRVVLRKGNLEVILTVAVADSGTAYEITGCGIEHHGGNGRVGDVVTRYRYTLADAKAHANGWAASLTAKGYRIAR